MEQNGLASAGVVGLEPDYDAGCSEAKMEQGGYGANVEEGAFNEGVEDAREEEYGAAQNEGGNIGADFLNAHMPVISGIFPEPVMRRINENPHILNIAHGLIECVERGELPRNLNVDEYVKLYPDFLSDCAKFGVGAAVRTIKALENQGKAQQDAILSRAARNRALPSSTKPTYAGEKGGAKDYRNMSSKEFKKLRSQMKDAYLRGENVKI